MIPFFQAGQSFVVAKGNPDAIKTTDDLCGKSVGVENGTTEADHLSGEIDVGACRVAVGVEVLLRRIRQVRADGQATGNNQLVGRD